MTETCKHEKSVKSNVSRHGLLGEVTVCVECGEALDYRPLREKDRAGSVRTLPADEAEIQERAAIAKAEEVRQESAEEMDALPVTRTGRPVDGLHKQTEASKKGMGMGDWIPHPSLAPLAMPCPSCGVVTNPYGVCEEKGCKLVGRKVIKVSALTDSGLAVTPASAGGSHQGPSVVLCQKHGGKLAPCDAGSARANQCHHSKWGSLRTFNSPCACLGCHNNR